jgi:hypothetical protein
MATTGGDQPAVLRDLPEPVELHRALSRHHALNWGDPLPTKAQLVAEFGGEAARLALDALRARIAVEPAATAEFVEALSGESTSYKLESRVKSPQSLARKYSDQLETLDDSEPDDILRYTLLTDSPDQLVAETHQAVDRLCDSGWRPESAMHSYTEGSRYKGIHVSFQRPSGETVEVQFHSASSVRVKEATTTPYEIERSADAPPAERAAARALCIELSDSLEPPANISAVQSLGDLPVEVKTFGDSRQGDPSAPEKISSDSKTPVPAAYRSTDRHVEETSR